MSLPSLDEGTLDELYQWLETIPFSRPRKNIAKDFADGILVAELVAHSLPRYVDLHSYMPANSVALKKYNWEMLSKNVFKHLNFNVSAALINQIVNGKVGAIEYFLFNLRTKIDLAISQQRFRPQRYRSRSSSRAGSYTSLNTEPDELLSFSPSAASASSTRLARDKTVNLLRFAISPPVKGKNQLCEDLVPARLLHNAQQQLLSKDEQVQTLFSRVKHLERVIQLKDDRITQLMQRLDRLAQVFYANQQKPDSGTEPNSSDNAASSQDTVNELVASLLTLKTAVENGPKKPELG